MLLPQPCIWLRKTTATPTRSCSQQCRHIAATTARVFGELAWAWRQCRFKPVSDDRSHLRQMACGELAAKPKGASRIPHFEARSPKHGCEASQEQTVVKQGTWLASHACFMIRDTESPSAPSLHFDALAPAVSACLHAAIWRARLDRNY